MVYIKSAIVIASELLMNLYFLSPPKNIFSIFSKAFTNLASASSTTFFSGYVPPFIFHPALT
jgi:hypothetical protein